MRVRLVAAMLLLAFVVQSCHRAFTPYEAANHPRGKRCGTIR